MGAEESGFLVYFPDFVLSVDTAGESHLSFDPLGHSAPLSTLHYVQPHSPPPAYPYASLPALSTALPMPAPPNVIEDDDANSANGDASSTASSSPSPTPILSDLSSTLQDLAVAIQHLSTAPSQTTAVVDPTPASPSESSADFPSPLSMPGEPWLLSTMTAEEILWLVHYPGTTLPSVRPCDTANGSDTKTHWLSEELHRTMGCRKFRNYKHLLHVSLDGTVVFMAKASFPPFCV